MASSKSPRQTQDFISNLPDVATDKILSLLPIPAAATTSLLSRQWRRNWLSLKHLNFDEEFRKAQNKQDGSCNWQKCCNIISSILFHHNGPIYDFNLYIPEGADDDCMNLSQWLSFLSKNEVKKITLDNYRSNPLFVPSCIFWCTELVHLELFCFDLNPPPIGFGGFPKLETLNLYNIKFTQQDIIRKLMPNCPVLDSLSLQQWSGMDHIFLDIPSLDALIVVGEFKSLSFGNVDNLDAIRLHLNGISENLMTTKTVDAFNLLAISCELEYLRLNGQICKHLAAGIMERRLHVTFNHLTQLFLDDVNLGDYRILGFVFGMVEICPYIEELRISVIPSENTKQGKVDCNKSHKLNELTEVKIVGITGSSAELKLIEHLLAVSSVLEKLMFQCGKLDTEIELKLSRALLGFPRASPKARIICLM